MPAWIAVRASAFARGLRAALFVEKGLVDVSGALMRRACEGGATYPLTCLIELMICHMCLAAGFRQDCWPHRLQLSRLQLGQLHGHPDRCAHGLGRDRRQRRHVWPLVRAVGPLLGFRLRDPGVRVSFFAFPKRACARIRGNAATGF